MIHKMTTTNRQIIDLDFPIIEQSSIYNVSDHTF